MLRNLESDAFFLHSIKPHSLDKILRHNFYARVFSTSMKNKWPQRAYLGLYSGPGRAQIEGTGEIIETSPLGAIRLPDPFTHYIFVDDDERCTDALSKRIRRVSPLINATVIRGDVNEVVPDIKAALPKFSKDKGLISFCFVDPFAANLRFKTIRSLSEYKMDFLVLLMLGRDVRTNFQRYYEDSTNPRIADLIDSADWRDEYRRTGGSIVRFCLRKFNDAMTGLGYQPTRDDLIHQVKVTGKNVFLYSLVLYSKHELGQTLWSETLERTDPQLGFGL